MVVKEKKSKEAAPIDGRQVLEQRRALEALAEQKLMQLREGERFDADALEIFHALGWDDRKIRGERERVRQVRERLEDFGTYDDLEKSEAAADLAEAEAKKQAAAINEKIDELHRQLNVVHDSAKAARRDATTRRTAMVLLLDRLLPEADRERIGRMQHDVDRDYAYLKQGRLRVEVIGKLLALNPDAVTDSAQIDLSTSHRLRGAGQVKPGGRVPLDAAKVEAWKADLRAERAELIEMIEADSKEYAAACGDIERMRNHYLGDPPDSLDLGPVVVPSTPRPRTATAPRGAMPDVVVGPVTSGGMGFTKPAPVEE